MDENLKNVVPCKASYVAFLLAACLLQSACSALPKGEVSLDVGIKDRGVASWYGKEFHGKLAANGDVFDMTAYTAAHRKLPLGSIVRVLNLENGKAVQVRITDRGPYVIGRMLDLSQAAAQALEMIETGTTAVQIEVIGDHRIVAPLPPRGVPAFAGTLLGWESRPTRERRPSEEGVERAAMTTPTMSQQALYARRERRIGSMLAAGHTAHNAVAVLIIS
ncbi:MAG: septal ring lytic transglycosylase RlpA family protein [Nitrospira sp.]|nr:septal ring lytic transglycosylase RlpA family protein [Nitrospira sp.]